MEIIPAIDILEGKCVRLSQGDYAQKKIYNEKPLESAKQFENAGIKRLHLVDLDGAKKGAIVNQKVLETIASKTKLLIDFGGGIKTDEDIQSVYNAGAQIAAIGGIAVKNSELFFSWVKKYGSDKILLGADVKEATPALKRENTESKYHVAVNGWTEQTEILIFDFIKTNYEHDVINIFCTDISKDGMMQGASVSLYKKIKEKFPGINLIASGGISSVKDIEDVRDGGCSGVIIGKAIYEGKIKLADLKCFLR